MCLVVHSGRELPKIALQAAATKIAAKMVNLRSIKIFVIALLNYLISIRILTVVKYLRSH
jgi:hypothetical protein